MLKPTGRTGNPTRFSGGSRVIVDGLLQRETVGFLTLVCAGLALALTALLASRFGAGWLVYPLFLGALLLGWFYSSEPLRLEARGVGELLTALLAAFLVPHTAYYLQASSLSATVTLAAVPLTFLVFGLTLSVELPDYEADRDTGKRNLVVRAGKQRACSLFRFTLVAFYVSSLSLAVLGFPTLVSILLAFSLPLAINGYRSFQRAAGEPAPDNRTLERAPFWASALLLYARSR